MMDQITIQQMNRGRFNGKWFCSRKNGVEYLHADGSWKISANESAYFKSREEIETLLKQAASV